MQVYVFDFDGVIADTFEVLTQFVHKYTFRSMEKSRLYILDQMMKNEQENFFERVVKNFLAGRFEKYLESLDNSLIFEDRLSEIQKLSGRKVILTNNYGSICKSILKDRQSIFDLIISDDIADTKVKGFELIINEFECKYEDMYFFTDTVGDILEAREVLDPFQVYAVSWGYHSKETINSSVYDQIVIDNFKDFIL